MKILLYTIIGLCLGALLGSAAVMFVPLSEDGIKKCMVNDGTNNYIVPCDSFVCDGADATGKCIRGHLKAPPKIK